jgi:fatty-acyl-CoA synthase
MAFTQVLPTHRTLVGRICANADKGNAITFLTAPGGPDRVSWATIHAEAKSMAAVLQKRGIEPGTRVALLGPTTRALVTAIQATWLAGATLVVLPLPMRLGSLDAFVEATRSRVDHADTSLLIVDDDLIAFVDHQTGDAPMLSLSDLGNEAKQHSPGSWKQPALNPNELAILQFTSGSTADPKGVMLPHDTLCHNLDAITVAGEIDTSAEVFVSWLPLYHDMGLIGLFTLPMTLGAELALAAPQDFIASPGRWMQWMSDYRGTATAGPNFSYALAARALSRMDGIDLSSWRVGLNGAEPVDPVTVQAFIDAAGKHGMDPRAVFCAFGMAEACLAVTFPKPFSSMETDCVDRRVLESDRYAAPVSPEAPNARRFAKLGWPVPGLEVRVMDPAGPWEARSSGERSESEGSGPWEARSSGERSESEGSGPWIRGPLAEREVGELQIRGTSVTPGYFNRPDATAATFDGDWLKTGDLAYLVDGQVVVCGRIKDMIIVGGRNVFPEDVERAVGLLDGVRVGNVIAFGVRNIRDREGLVVVAESKPDTDMDAVRSLVQRCVRETIGFAAIDVVLVSPGTLPKTSSGKLQRSLCRDQYEQSQLSELATASVAIG